VWQGMGVDPQLFHEMLHSAFDDSLAPIGKEWIGWLSVLLAMEEVQKL